MWNGRYETESFLSYSSSFKAINNIFLKSQTLVGYQIKFLAEMKGLTRLYGVIGKGKIRK